MSLRPGVGARFGARFADPFISLGAVAARRAVAAVKRDWFILVVSVLVLVSVVSLPEVNSAFSGSTGNVGSSFTAASSFCHDVTPAWVTGFEYGTYQAGPWGRFNDALLDGESVGGSGSSTVTSAVARTGVYSLNINKVSGSNRATWKTFTGDDPYTTGAVARVAVNFATLPSADVNGVMDVWGANPVERMAFVGFVAASKKFTLTWSTGETQTVTSMDAVTAGTWYVIDLKVTTGSPGTATVRVTSAGQSWSLGPLSGSGTSSGFSEFDLGSATNEDVFNAYYDDILVGTDTSQYPFPDGGVRALTPNQIISVTSPAKMQDDAGGAVDVGTPGDAGKLNSIPVAASSPSAYIKDVESTSEYYTRPDPFVEVGFTDVTESGCVNGVEAVVGRDRIGPDWLDDFTYVWDGTTGRSLHDPEKVDGGFGYATSAISPAASRWTTTTLNAARATFGYAWMGADTPGAWHALMLEYDQSRAPATCPTMDPAWLTGFEYGTLSTSGKGLFSTVAGSVAVDNAVLRSGTYSLKVTKGSGSASDVVRNDLSSIATALTARLAVRLDTLPSAATVWLATFVVNGETVKLGYKNTGRFTLLFSSGTQVDSTSVTTAVAATWYRFDIGIDTTVSPRTASWRIDGTAQTTTATRSSSASGSTTSVLLGTSSTGTETYVANYDDVTTTTRAADYPLPDGHISSVTVDTMTANPNPTQRIYKYAGDVAADAGSASLIDDDPATGTGDYVYQNTADAAGYAEYSFADISNSSCVTGVSGVVARNQSGTSGSAAARTDIVDDTGALQTRIFDTTDSITTINSALEYRTRPILGGSWDKTRLNRMRVRVGYASSVTKKPRWHAIRLEYDQVP